MRGLKFYNAGALLAGAIMLAAADGGFRSVPGGFHAHQHEASLTS